MSDDGQNIPALFSDDHIRAIVREEIDKIISEKKATATKSVLGFMAKAAAATIAKNQQRPQDTKTEGTKDAPADTEENH